MEFGAQTKDIAHTLRAPTWKEAEGKKTGKARLDARGYQEPGSRDGDVDFAGRVSGRPSFLQLISLGVLKKWMICSLAFKNAFRQADGFDREVFRFAFQANGIPEILVVPGN